jgi:DNA polymerase
LIKPSVIVTLGRFSMERYFPGQSISRIHGRPKRVGNVFYLPMFHPAAALRNPAWRHDMVKDFAQIPEFLAQLQGHVRPGGSPELSPAGEPAEGEPDDKYQQLTLF